MKNLTLAVNFIVKSQTSTCCDVGLHFEVISDHRADDYRINYCKRCHNDRIFKNMNQWKCHFKFLQTELPSPHRCAYFSHVSRYDTNSNLKQLMQVNTNYSLEPVLNFYTPLQLTVILQREEIFTTILNSGVDVFKTAELGNRALHYAAMCKQKKFLCDLLKKYCIPGPSIHKPIKLYFHMNETNNNQETALFKAASFGRTNNVKILIKSGCDVNIPALDEQTALLVSLRKGFDKIGEMLLKAGAEFKVPAKWGESAFELAIRNDCLKSFNFLVEAGAGIHQANSFVGNILHYALRLEMAKYLDENGVDVNHRDKYGRSPLYMAVKNKLTDLVNLLVSNGADVNAVTTSLDTPLMLAAKLLSLESVSILLAAGADVNLQNRLGYTALFIAAKPFSLMHNADYCVTLFTELLSSNPNLSLQDHLGRTLLMLVLKNKNLVDIVRSKNLIFKGNHINAKDKQGRTLLVHACQNKDVSHELISQLLTYGDDPVLSDKHKCILNQWIAAQNPNDYFFFYKNSQLLRLLVNNNLTMHISAKYISRVDIWNCPEMIRQLPAIDVLVRTGPVGSVRYLIANCCLGFADIQYLRDLHCRFLNNEMNYPHKAYLINAFSNPWPLVKLSFIAVSALLGDGPERANRVQHLPVLPVIQELLMFQTPLARLPVSEWTNIPICFDLVEYETLPQPRPLLYCWPMGKMYT
ncbi:hypothetical protein Btru_070394 [Bulinus truncatus]|nr:hypothetical protein Btru_070394 [Bulinus truncatus]